MLIILTHFIPNKVVFDQNYDNLKTQGRVGLFQHTSTGLFLALWSNNGGVMYTVVTSETHLCDLN